MQTSELKITKTPLKEELVSSAKSESTTKPSLNAQATDVFLQKISAERPYVSENLQRSLNSLHASLSEKLKNPVQDSNTPHNPSANAPLARLSTKLIERDPTLQEKTARALSTASKPVSSRQAVTTLKQSLAVLPASLQEGNETGDALGRTLTGTLSDLSDHPSMGAGLIRDLAVRGIYVTQDSLPLKNRAAAERMLSNTISFIRSNSPEVLSTLAPNKTLNSTSSNTPSLRAEHNTEVTTNEDLRNNTYLDIFKKKDLSTQKNSLETPSASAKTNAQVADEIKSTPLVNDSEDVVSDSSQNSNLKNFAEPSERIRQIIEKAADTVRRGNLMRSDDTTSRKETTSPNENQHTPLRDLVSRASMLERQFREERQRLNTDENATANTQSQKTVVASKDGQTQALQNNALNTSSNTFKDLNKAQFSFSYSAIQNSFYGGIASVPGMDLPVEDFNSSEVKDFIANSQAAELNSKKILNTVLRERRELLQGNENVDESIQTPVSKDTEASLKKNEVDNKAVLKAVLNEDAGDTLENNSHSSDLKKTTSQSQVLSDGNTKEPKAQDVDKLEKTSAKDVAEEEIANKSLPEDKVENKAENESPENIKQELKTSNDEVNSSKIAESTSQSNESEVSYETSSVPVATPSQTQKALEDANKDENADVLEQNNTQQNNVSKASIQTEDFSNEQDSNLEKNVLSKQAVESVKAFEKANTTELVAENADANKSATGKKNEGILNFLTPTGKKDENLTPNTAEQDRALNVAENISEDVVLEENNKKNATNLTQTATQSSTQNIQNFVNTPDNQALPSAASIVTSGGNEPLPQRTMPEFSAVTKEDGLFKRIASLFSRSEQTSNSTNELNSQMIAEVAVKVPLLKNTPFDVFMQSLSVASGNLKLPESVRKEAQKLKEQLASPLADLKAVDSWLSFVTGPMSPSSTQAIALQQWAFLLLCLRFKQIGKNISSFLKKNDLKGLDRELEDMLLPFPDCKDDIADLSAQALEQIASAQQKQSEGNPVLSDRYLPLPPSYEGGHEGGMILRSTRNEKGQKVWHMTFQFDLEKIGAVEIKAVACLPEVRLSFAAETLEGLRSMQNNCGHLAESLEKIGLQAKTSAPRLGRISPLSGARESKPLAPSPATGISLEI